MAVKTLQYNRIYPHLRENENSKLSSQMIEWICDELMIDGDVEFHIEKYQLQLIGEYNKHGRSSRKLEQRPNYILM